MNEIEHLATVLNQALAEKAMKLATAESCTGGWVAKAMTDIPGSSTGFDRGFVTYSNESKQAMLGVDQATLEQYGAVSEETVHAMVAGALEQSNASIALAISGVAGPGGGTDEKPVGMVCFAWGGVEDIHVSTEYFSGNRDDIRRQSVVFVLQQVLIYTQSKETINE
jgi:nicotinamide-nucleotide amidase